MAASFCLSYGQTKKWAMYPNVIDFTGASPSSTALPNIFYPTSYAAHNGTFDENGNLLFYVQENRIYDPTGNQAGVLNSYSSYTAGLAQIAIVPVPGQCKKFYVIYSRTAVMTGVALTYALVDCSTGGIVITNNTTLIDVVGGNQAAFTVSKVSAAGAGGTYKLYSVNSDNVKVYTISSSGISSGTILFTKPSGSPSSYAQTDLDLNFAGTKLAWGHSGYNYLFQLNLSTNTLSTYNLPVPVPAGWQCVNGPAIGGVEYDQWDNLYISASILYPTNSNCSGAFISAGGLYKLSPGGTFTQLTFSGNYDNTQLESGYNKMIYAINNDGKLGSINPATGVVTNAVLPTVFNTRKSSGTTSLYRLPMQIDGISAPEVSFDGINDYVQIPKYTELDLGTGNFTFEARIKADPTQVSYPQIASYRTNTANGFLFGLWYDGKPFVQLGGSTGNWVAPSSPDLRDNQWHHVAVTRDLGTISYYVDGVSVGTLSVGYLTRNITSPGPLNIGYDAGSIGNTEFKGIISNLRIWNIARTSSDIYNNSYKKVVGTETGLIGAWELTEESGQIAYNKVSGKSNGTYGPTASVDANDPIRSTYFGCATSGGTGLKVENSSFAIESNTDAMTANEVAAFPNPFVDDLTLNYAAKIADNYNLKIADAQGKVVYTQQNLASDTNYNIGQHISEKGIYFLMIEENGTLKTYKVIKK